MVVRLLEISSILQLLLPYGDRAIKVEGPEKPDILSSLQGSIELWRSQLDRLNILSSEFRDGEVDELALDEIGALRSRFIAVKDLCGICSLPNTISMSSRMNILPDISSTEENIPLRTTEPSVHWGLCSSSILLARLLSVILTLCSEQM
jgi:hypothetical protein